MIPGVSMDVVNFENDSGNYAVTVIGAATATTIADSITTTGGSESHPTNQAEWYDFLVNHGESSQVTSQSRALAVDTTENVPISWEKSSNYMYSNGILSSGDLGFASSSAQYPLASQSPSVTSKSARSASVFGTIHAPLHVPATTAFAGLAGPSGTLVAGGRSMTFSDDTDPLIPSGTAHVVDGYTSVISHITAAPSVGVLGVETLSSTSGSSNIIIGSKTLIPGASAITVAGETVSLASSNGRKRTDNAASSHR